MIKKIGAVVCITLALVACNAKKKSDGKLNVVTTTTIITDLVQHIGGDHIHVQGLMGAGVDPHLYKASEGDVSKLYNADVIFYNGLHLEGKLVEVFEKMEAQDKIQVALAETLDTKGLIGSEYFASNYDPHVWFNISYFMEFARKVEATLAQIDPEHATFFASNLEAYLKELNMLKHDMEAMIDRLPKEQRILVTAHDAFNYFGAAYDFEVVGLQGLSTATEAGVQDVQRLSDFIIEKGVKAIFVESSVPGKTLEALQKAVLAKGSEVKIGGSLYSDALGDPGTEEGTYLGMFRHNVTTIVNELR